MKAVTIMFEDDDDVDLVVNALNQDLMRLSKVRKISLDSVVKCNKAKNDSPPKQKACETRGRKKKPMYQIEKSGDTFILVRTI